MTATKPGKKPQDRKPKEEKLEAVETTKPFRISTDYELRDEDGWEITVDGVTVFLPRAGLNDSKVTRILGKAQSGDRRAQAQFPVAVERIIGVEQYDMLEDALADPDTGRVPNERISEFLAELLKAVNPNG